MCGALTPFFCVRQDYEELEKQLKEVFKERSTVLRQLTKTSRELDGIKVNLQVSWKQILSPTGQINIFKQFSVHLWALPLHLMFTIVLALK